MPISLTVWTNKIQTQYWDHPNPAQSMRPCPAHLLGSFPMGQDHHTDESWHSQSFPTSSRTRGAVHYFPGLRQSWTRRAVIQPQWHQQPLSFPQETCSFQSQGEHSSSALHFEAHMLMKPQETTDNFRSPPRKGQKTLEPYASSIGQLPSQLPDLALRRRHQRRRHSMKRMPVKAETESTCL